MPALDQGTRRVTRKRAKTLTPAEAEAKSESNLREAGDVLRLGRRIRTRVSDRHLPPRGQPQGRIPLGPPVVDAP